MVTSRFSTVVGMTAALALAAGCSVHKTEAPSLTGPSGLGTNITVSISPDVLPRDGQSQSLVTVAATNPNGQPMPNLSIRLAVVDPQSGLVTDALGTLSALNIVTNSSGQATAVFTAPAAIQGASVSTVVEIGATPAGSDFGNEQMRVAQIQLVPEGVIGAPPSSLKPDFVPPAPTAGDAAVFSATVVDASGNNAINQVTSFNWNFGDGGTATGQSVTHTYGSPGTVAVTLTIKDQEGNSAYVTHGLTVAQGQLPVAAFVISPSSASVKQSINFNAEISTAAPGHTIADYAWNFGDGQTADGVEVSHAYSQAGSYTVVLKITDDAGRTATATQTVTVGTGQPTASFTFSPSSPIHGTSVQFNGSTSQPATGRTIVTYVWSWGDGTPNGNGPITSHTFVTPGTYTVTLTVIDDQGNTGTATQSVTVS